MKNYEISVYDNVTRVLVASGSGSKPAGQFWYNGETILQVINPTANLKNGKDYIWNVKMYQPDPNILVTNGIVQSGSSTTSFVIRKHPQVVANMYIMINNELKGIQSYNQSTGAIVVKTPFTFTPNSSMSYQIFTDFVVSSDFFFKARNNPIFSITAFPSPITSRTYTFTASYSQTQGVPIKYQIWTLRDNNNNIIDTTGKLYNSNLRYVFDGFIADENYNVECTVSTQDEVFVTDIEPIIIRYPAPTTDFPPSIVTIREKNAAEINWVSSNQSIGEITAGGVYEFQPDYPFVGTDSLFIRSGNVYFDKLSGDPLQLDDFTIFTDVSFHGTMNQKIVELVGDDNLFVDVANGKIRFVKNGIITILGGLYEFTVSGQQPYISPKAGYNYVWVDEDAWNDNYYWTETLPLYVRIKLTIYPNGAEYFIATSFAPITATMFDSRKIKRDEFNNKNITVSQFDTTASGIL